MIRTAATLLFIVLALFLLLPWLILWTLLVRNADGMYSFAMSYVRFLNRIAGIRVRTEGLDHIPSSVCIFVSNHCSNIDPPAMFPSIPRRVSILAKKQVFHIPVLGAALRLARFVPVDRGDREAAAASVDFAVQYLKEGLSFCVYPEGTRSRDGRLKPFKRGTFIMAIQARVPIVPVALIGTQRLMRKGDWAVHPGEVVVRFLPPVDSAAYSLDRRGELLEVIHARIAAALPPDQQPLAQDVPT
ncbi:MAG TPA: lysophospholipid acyltransferase family protein [Candidatus Acidoferrum sp.]|nr:lysophospholipid acyltransferase family protein [Candidatus Acidoferrum sp.]